MCVYQYRTYEIFIISRNEFIDPGGSILLSNKCVVLLCFPGSLICKDMYTQCF